MNSVTFKLEPSISQQQFTNIVQQNPDWKLELTATGELVIMPPTGGETGHKNSQLNGQLWLWNRQYKLGIVFDSSTAFRLPNGAIRSPDASFITLSRWSALSQEEKKRFSPICPDFVIELLSPSDNLKETQAKLQEYLDNGCQLGWLIDPQKQQVEVYRLVQDKETIEKPDTLLGEDILPGFTLELTTIW